MVICIKHKFIHRRIEQNSGNPKGPLVADSNYCVQPNKFNMSLWEGSIQPTMMWGITVFEKVCSPILFKHPRFSHSVKGPCTAK